MSEKKMKIRFFTIADYEEEEIWLREQHQKGWKLENMIIPCFYFFEKCEPEDVVYRLDYKNCKGSSDYMQMFSGYGWEYFCQCIGWLYFRKPVFQIPILCLILCQVHLPDHLRDLEEADQIEYINEQTNN